MTTVATTTTTAQRPRMTHTQTHRVSKVSTQKGRAGPCRSKVLKQLFRLRSTQRKDDKGILTFVSRNSMLGAGNSVIQQNSRTSTFASTTHNSM